MKILKLLIGDVRFQYKYGFYFIYFIFSLLYIALFQILPNTWGKPIAYLLIFSDPSAIGLIFMGAIIQLEISEKTINSLYIAPIKPSEYLISKLLSIAIISTAVGLAIGISAEVITNYFWFIIGLILGSMICSALGLILAFKTNSLNQFFLVTIPTIMFIVMPGGGYLLGQKNPFLILHPGVSIIELLKNGASSFISFIILLIWGVVLILFANKVVTKRFRQESGGRNERNH